VKYYIQRQLQEYGPYTLAELQRYVASGNILMTDLARSEGMTDWVPVSQVIGNIPVPLPPPVPAAGGYVAPAGQVYSGQPANAYGVATAPLVPTPGSGPIPPDFHWALVLLINFFCFIFGFVWLLVEAAFVKKISPSAKHMGFLIGAVVCIVIGYIGGYAGIIAASAAQGGGSENVAAVIALGFFLLLIVGAVLYWVGVFQMRSALQNYYNTVEPINLRLSGVMTFFFALYYFQYHFSRISQWKKTGQLQPQ
jgi:hypothetical protein